MKSDEPKRINVTQPYLPKLEELIPYLEEIWKEKRVTNNGPMHQELEKKMCEFLGVKHISLFCNGTIALLVAMKALRLSGEVITTPYSFVATTHSIRWNGLDPVFVDIDHRTCNLDPDLIESVISDKSSAIMPVHVYGIPCNIEKIKEIADKYDLKVIYDAAHAFGVQQHDRSILNAGDLSVLSFHGTKVFNTFEGGAIVCHSRKMKQRIDDLKNFSFHGEESVTGLGINGKMNEVQAAMGLLQLKDFDTVVNRRRSVDEIYRKGLANIAGVEYPGVSKKVRHNYSYFPVFIDEYEFGKSRDALYEELKLNNIYARKYFYPLISHFAEYKSLPSSRPSNLIVAEKMSREVLCLPIYPELAQNDIERIVNLIGGKI
jgi:dTDP-4-amino-4,6-dideoxygalactose transaminase